MAVEQSFAQPADALRRAAPGFALAAAVAIADVVGADKINPSVIVPSVFDVRVAPAVAAAVRGTAPGRLDPVETESESAAPSIN